MYDDVWEPDKSILTGTKYPNNKKPVAKRHSNRAVPAAEAALPVSDTPCVPLLPGAQEGSLPEGREAPAMLDTLLHSSDKSDTSFRRTLSRASRRFYSRALLGMKIPGKYYFLTYTTCMTTKHPVGYYWESLWRWHTRYRPGSCCIYGITSEGKAMGVIHMIVRLLPHHKRMEATELRAHWQRMTGAVQLKIVRVDSTKTLKLAAYIADQRAKNGMASEMAYQGDYLQRWRWTTGWLPKGFTRAFGRAWMKLQDAPPEIRKKALNDWLNACYLKPEKVGLSPRIRRRKTA
jgi:hypothetical protein